MLVLSRKKNETIVVLSGPGPDAEILAEICVVEIKGDKVRLGIEAPRDMPVHRREVHNAIQRSQQADADTQSEPTEVAEVALAAGSVT